MKVLWLVLLLAAPVSAEQRLALPTTSEQRVADLASWATVLTALTLDGLDTPRSRGPLLKTGLRVGLAIGTTQIVKQLVHRHRPCAPVCGIDSPDSSFFSMHTTLAFSTLGGPRLAFAIPLAVGTGTGRVLANKHWLTDTLVGAGVGAALSRIR
jgi:membrane-associated phospholipid phosphatase